MQIQLKTMAAQVATALRAEVLRGTWRSTLPGERQLAERLQVSRKTLRKALAALRSEGFLTTLPNRASMIAARRKGNSAATTTRIALLLPDSLEGSRPFTILWVNRLMSLLQDRGLQLEIFTGSNFYGPNPSSRLSRLTRANPARCWLLARSTLPMQRWFSESGLTALICGSAHDHVALPSVDIDHRALCHHAASTLLRAGHQRMAVFFEAANNAGDAESRDGFTDGLRAGGVETPPPIIVRVERQPTMVAREMKRMLALPHPPTAMLLFHSETYLTVSGYLGHVGVRVPRDVSLICRDEEPFLKFVYPAPARYEVRAGQFAAKLSQALKRIDEGERSHFCIRIMPTFVRGESLRDLR